jgi:hypothetical protein
LLATERENQTGRGGQTKNGEDDSAHGNNPIGTVNERKDKGARDGPRADAWRAAGSGFALEYGGLPTPNLAQQHNVRFVHPDRPSARLG